MNNGLQYDFMCRDVYTIAVIIQFKTYILNHFNNKVDLGSVLTCMLRVGAKREALSLAALLPPWTV